MEEEKRKDIVCQIKKQKFVPSKIFQQQTENINRINYHNVLKRKANAKNVPKMFGNYFLKYLLKICKNKVKSLPLELQKFILKGEQTTQSNYNIEDFQQFCYDNQSQKIFQKFLEKSLIIDLLQSNKVESASSFIGFIEFYQAISKDPEHFNCNRIKNY